MKFRCDPANGGPKGDSARAQRVPIWQKITNSPINLKVFSWLSVVAYATLIFYLSDQPQTPSINMPFFDKFLHTIEYAIFGFLLMRAFKNSGFNLDNKTALSLSVIVVFVYGISDEIHQAFVLNRTASIFDALFDLIGGSCGAYLYYRHKFRNPNIEIRNNVKIL